MMRSSPSLKTGLKLRLAIGAAPDVAGESGRYVTQYGLVERDTPTSYEGRTYRVLHRNVPRLGGLGPDYGKPGCLTAQADREALSGNVLQRYNLTSHATSLNE